jgi:hypothetical protein
MIAVECDCGEVGDRFHQGSFPGVDRILVGEGEDTHDRGCAVPQNGERQVAPEGGPTRPGRQDIERGHRVHEGMGDRVIGITQCHAEAGGRGIVQANARNDRQGTGAARNDNYGRLDAKVLGGHREQRVQAGLSSLALGNGAGSADEDLAGGGVGGHGWLSIVVMAEIEQ